MPVCVRWRLLIGDCRYDYKLRVQVCQTLQRGMPKLASAKLSIVHIHDERRCWPPRTADLLHSAEWRCLTAQVGEPRSESPARLHAEPERHLPAVDQSADIVMAADEQRADTAPSARRPSADNHRGAMPNDALDPLPTAPADLVRDLAALQTMPYVWVDAVHTDRRAEPRPKHWGSADKSAKAASQLSRDLADAFTGIDILSSQESRSMKPLCWQGVSFHVVGDGKWTDSLCGAAADAIRVSRFSSLAPTAGSLGRCPRGLRAALSRRGAEEAQSSRDIPRRLWRWVSPTLHAVRYTAGQRGTAMCPLPGEENLV